MTTRNIVGITLSIICVFVMFFAIYRQAEALTVSPARLELSGDPGKEIYGEFSLINEQEETKTFYSSVENFEAQGESGTPSFVESKEGLASWITLAPEITLQKGEKAKVAFTLRIPQGAEAGGHFAAVFLSTVPPATDNSQVSIGAKIGVLVLLRVSGDITEGGGIVDFTTKNKSAVFASLPVDFSYRFSNTGNDRANPSGEVIIKNIFGLTTAHIQANENQGNVLPGSTRKFDLSWKKGDEIPKEGFFAMAFYELRHFALGRYVANLELKYGTSEHAEATKVIYLFPWQLLLIVLILLIAITGIFIKILKRYNQWIIKSAHAI